MTSIKLSNKPLKVYSSSCTGIRDHEDLAKMQSTSQYLQAVLLVRLKSAFGLIFQVFGVKLFYKIFY